MTGGFGENRRAQGIFEVLAVKIMQIDLLG